MNSNSITVSEINTVLEEDEKLGYASYVHFDADFISFASTIFAPKLDKFGIYIDQIFTQIGAGHIRFGLQSLTMKATKQEILDIPIHGRTWIEFPRSSNMATQLAGLFGIDTNSADYHELESLEVVFKPKYKKSISQVNRDFINTVNAGDFSSFVVKAKAEAASSALAYHMDSYADIVDFVSTSKAATVHSQMIEKIHENSQLSAALQRQRSQDDESEKKIMILALMISLTLIGGFLPIEIYKKIVEEHPNLSVALYPVKKDFIGPLIGINTTLLGFLAAFVTLMFGLNDNRFSRNYKKRGYLGIFIGYYYFALSSLVISIFICLLNLSKAAGTSLFYTMIVSTTISILSVCAVSIIIVNVTNKSGVSDPQPSNTHISGPKL